MIQIKLLIISFAILFISCDNTNFIIRNIDKSIFPNHVLIVLQGIEDNKFYYVINVDTAEKYYYYDAFRINSRYYFNLKKFANILITKRYLHEADINETYSFETYYPNQLLNYIKKRNYQDTLLSELNIQQKVKEIADIEKAGFNEVLGMEKVETKSILAINKLIFTDLPLVISNNRYNYLIWRNDSLIGDYYFSIDDDIK